MNISAITVQRILRKAGLKKTKPTRKLGLTKRMKKERLNWCLTYYHQTLKDWKRVIQTNETSVVLYTRCGGYRIWRTSEERFYKSIIRERQKGYSEFIFQGSFLYDKKGSYHIWGPKTKNDREFADKELARLNEELEPIMKAQWELETSIRRLSLRNKLGKKLEWK